MLKALTRKLLIASALSIPFMASFAPSAFAVKEDFWIENNTSVNLDYLFISESNLDSWGDDVLGPEYILVPGDHVEILFNNPDPSVCIYDIRGEFADGDVVEDFQVDVCSISSYEFYEVME